MSTSALPGRLVTMLALSAGLAGGSLAQCESPIDVGRGPVTFHVPDSHRPGQPIPMVVLLHGYSSTPDANEHWLGLRRLADEFGFLYVLPQGTIDARRQPFWNAGPVCCNWYGSTVDDVGYLAGLITAISDRCDVDPGRIYWIGHSNGAFMSYRMACEHAEMVTGLAAIAGVTENDPARCDPFKPVHVLHVHGTADHFWHFEGGVWSGNGEAYPGALRTAEIWAGYNGCSPATEELPDRLDLETAVAGAESTITRFPGPCRPGGSVELWSVEGADHTPHFSPGFSRRVIESLLAQRNRCRGRESIRRATCRQRNGLLTLVLNGGLPGDAFGLALSGGQGFRGQLDAKGRARLRIRGLEGQHGLAEAAWGCGSTASIGFDCR